MEESGGGPLPLLREELRVKWLPPFLLRAEAPALLGECQNYNFMFFSGVKNWYRSSYLLRGLRIILRIW